MNEETSDLGPVRATIVVTAEAADARRLPPVLARGWRMLLLATGAPAVVVAVIALASSGARSPGVGVATSAPAPRADHEAAMFGIRVDCPRLALVTPDGQYARADYEMYTPCGSYGNYVTMILHRVHGAWLREFIGTGPRCTAGPLPARILAELQLCPAP